MHVCKLRNEYLQSKWKYCSLFILSFSFCTNGIVQKVEIKLTFYNNKKIKINATFMLFLVITQVALQTGFAFCINTVRCRKKKHQTIHSVIKSSSLA